MAAADALAAAAAAVASTLDLLKSSGDHRLQLGWLAGETCRAMCSTASSCVTEQNLALIFLARSLAHSHHHYHSTLQGSGHIQRGMPHKTHHGKTGAAYAIEI